MTSRQLLIIGAGGHAKVVIDTAQAAGQEILGLVDDNSKLWGQALLGIPILGGRNLIHTYPNAQLIHGIGANAVRKQLAMEYADCNWTTLIHPRAYVAKSATVGKGTVVFAQAVIQPHALVGNHCIVNTAATVDHDCVISDYVHLGPGTHLAANVKIEQGAFLGAGAVGIPGAKIGEWSTIGAGGVVTSSIPSHTLAVGVPASVIKHIKI